MKVLGIESSCDDTSLACLDEGHVVACCSAGQEAFHQKYGGVVPEIAARAHLETINQLYAETLEQAGWGLGDVELIAVTQGPGLLGSLLVGVTLGKSLALLTGTPIVGVNHLLAHCLSAQLAVPDEPLPYPNVTLIASGGHTDLIHCPEAGVYVPLGTTRDDAAGEVLDKVGRELGLGFPAGAAIDRLATQGVPSRYELPRPMIHEEHLDFSFSGLKTAALRAFGLLGGVRQAGDQRLMPTDDLVQMTAQELADRCAALQAAVMETLAAKTLRAAESIDARAVVLGGGVAANSELRRRLTEGCAERGLTFHAPPLKYCMDNGAMIALAGLHQYRKQGPDSLDFDPFATWDWATAWRRNGT